MNIALVQRSTQCLTLLCILSVVLISCSSSPATIIPSNVPAPITESGTYWPTEAWRTSTPEEQGMDPQKLAQMLAAIQQQHLNLHSLLIIRNGYLVSETYFAPYEQDTKHELYSCTKSFISTLIGIALDKGYIEGIDHRIVDYFPDRTFANSNSQYENRVAERGMQREGSMLR